MSLVVGLRAEDLTAKSLDQLLTQSERVILEDAKRAKHSKAG